MDKKPKLSFFDKVLDMFSWVKNLFFSKELELSILGLQNAGKTTFVNVLANNKFDEDTIPTIGFNYRKLKKGKVEFKLWDLGKHIDNYLSQEVSLDSETAGKNTVGQLTV